MSDLSFSPTNIKPVASHEQTTSKKIEYPKLPQPADVSHRQPPADLTAVERFGYDVATAAIEKGPKAALNTFINGVSQAASYLPGLGGAAGEIGAQATTDKPYDLLGIGLAAMPILGKVDKLRDGVKIAKEVAQAAEKTRDAIKGADVASDVARAGAGASAAANTANDARNAGRQFVVGEGPEAGRVTGQWIPDRRPRVAGGAVGLVDTDTVREAATALRSLGGGTVGVAPGAVIPIHIKHNREAVLPFLSEGARSAVSALGKDAGEIFWRSVDTIAR